MYDYSWFSSTPDPYSKNYKLPKKSPDESLIVDESELYETFEISVDMESYARADIESELVLPDLKEYQSIAEGDTISLSSGEHNSNYNVVSVERKKDVSYTEEFNFKYRSIYTEEEKKQIVERYENAENKIVIKLEYDFFFQRKK